jgi:regulator of replication initiation timing
MVENQKLSEQLSDNLQTKFSIDSISSKQNEGDILIDTEYQNLLKIYTDGSKDPQNNTNGCAFAIPELNVSKGFKLQSHISIFMCELTAIFLITKLMVENHKLSEQLSDNLQFKFSIDSIVKRESKIKSLFKYYTAITHERFKALLFSYIQKTSLWSMKREVVT